LANHKSALKRARQSEEKRLRNKGYKTRVKNVVKDVRTAAAGHSPEAGERFKEAVSVIQKTACKGIIHKNSAGRKVSRLARLVNRAQKSA
jgi:small subunit ribosomal protein S20